jgi:hypothetical protein
MATAKRNRIRPTVIIKISLKRFTTIKNDSLNQRRLRNFGLSRAALKGPIVTTRRCQAKPDLDKKPNKVES